jgi:hypothetical protein
LLTSALDVLARSARTTRIVPSFGPGEHAVAVVADLVDDDSRAGALEVRTGQAE